MIGFIRRPLLLLSEVEEYDVENRVMSVIRLYKVLSCYFLRPTILRKIGAQQLILTELNFLLDQICLIH